MPALNPAVGLDSVGGSLKHSAPFALTAAACSPQHGARGPLQTVTHQLSGARQSPTAAQSRAGAVQERSASLLAGPTAQLERTEPGSHAPAGRGAGAAGQRTGAPMNMEQ